MKFWEEFLKEFHGKNAEPRTKATAIMTNGMLSAISRSETLNFELQWKQPPSFIV